MVGRSGGQGNESVTGRGTKAAVAASAGGGVGGGGDSKSRRVASGSGKKQYNGSSHLQQQQQLVESFAQRVMVLELLLSGGGAVAGGSITAAAAIGSCAGSTRNSCGSMVAASLVTLMVLSGWWSASDGSIVFCCSQGPQCWQGSSRPMSNAVTTAARSRSDSYSSDRGISYFFAGKYTGGRLLGQWHCVDGSLTSAVAAAAAAGDTVQLGRCVEQCLCGSGGNCSTLDKWAFTPQPTAAAACYDWVMSDAVDGSSATERATFETAASGAAATEKGLLKVDARQQQQQSYSVCVGGQ
jgi:hypothetical protein